MQDRMQNRMPDGPPSRPRVAIAHDYLTQRGGAERVVLSLLRAFPDAVVHTTVYDPEGTYPEFRDYRIVTSPLNRHRVLRSDHRLAFPFLRRAASQMRVDADVVVVSTSGWAHGFDIRGKRLVYCHAPARWLYQPREYLGGPTWASPRGWALRMLRPGLLRWDAAAASGADRYLCNSRAIRGRIAIDYGIEAQVVPPPYGVDSNGPQVPIPGAAEWADDGYLLVVARLMPYKNVGQVVEAVRSMPEQRLVVIGHGPERRTLERDLPHNVRIFQHLPDAQLRWAYAHATALLAPSHEDFGLTPLEAAGHGKPTLALRAGGYLDTVREGVTGAFFDEPSVPAIRTAIAEQTQHEWDTAAIRAHATLFSEDRFSERIRREVDDLAGSPVTRSRSSSG